jgi:hypothetical protein
MEFVFFSMSFYKLFLALAMLATETKAVTRLYLPEKKTIDQIQIYGCVWRLVCVLILFSEYSDATAFGARPNRLFLIIIRLSQTRISKRKTNFE